MEKMHDETEKNYEVPSVVEVGSFTDLTRYVGPGSLPDGLVVRFCLGNCG